METDEVKFGRVIWPQKFAQRAKHFVKYRGFVIRFKIKGLCEHDTRFEGLITGTYYRTIVIKESHNNTHEIPIDSIDFRSVRIFNVKESIRWKLKHNISYELVDHLLSTAM